MRLLPVVLLIACGKPDTATKSNPFDAGAFARVDIFNIEGSVTVHAAASPVVQAELSWRGEVQPEFETRLAGETLIVTTGCPQEARACHVDLDVKVPEDVDVDVVATEGDVLLDGIAGVIDVEVLDGDLTLSEIAGNTRLSVPKGGVDMSAVSGRLELTVPEGQVYATELASPTFDLRGANEPVELEWAEQPDLVKVTTERGDITVRLPDGDYDVVTTTRRGTVSVTGINNSTQAGSVVLLTSTQGNLNVEGI
ncbi:MAG TPA: hypothetical protein PKA64_01375 [Myxococcota bacterium]|nr:hypothetical protein [Myxococcota bacterium]